MPEERERKLDTLAAGNGIGGGGGGGCDVLGLGAGRVQKNICAKLFSFLYKIIIM